ncbi:MAG TPA: diaminopimelate epimerase [Dehalococcoidia bacterium]|nr:diaminopimelate epimerase [Dehalococcoidia bacterium]
MRFTKMHGTGNDFVVLDGRRAAADWSALAVPMNDRHFGVGGDGLIVALPSDRADLRMRMFNPDGSEAEMCGNGIRCLAKYAVEQGLVASSRESLLVETLAGDLTCELRRERGAVTVVRVSMGAPQLDPRAIPVLAEQAPPVIGLPVRAGGREFAVTCVSMGNPHAVWFTDEVVAEFPLREFGPLVERHPAFPRRVNFEIVNIERPGVARARVWERGAGLTLACGTGACAVHVAARLNGLTGDATDVALPGGTLRIEWNGAGDLYLSGPAAAVFEGEWPG